MNILICGAGIAGPTLAYWLKQYGMQPTIVEQAPKLRTGGYVIDFWGAGFEIAERMGLLPKIVNKGYRVQWVSVVNERGKEVAGFPVKAFARIAHGKYTSLPRGDLTEAIFSSLNGVETIFGDTIERIDESSNAAVVTFASGATREFDLVVGADGLHSRVRQLVFGDENTFETYLGYNVAAFETSGYQPRDELVYVMFTELGQQVGRFTMLGDRTMFLLIFAEEQSGSIGTIDEQKKLLHRRFGNSGWECRRILDELDRTDDLYFDRVSQIRMGPGQSWSRGRVVLLGDAASCVSLLAGQGSALAMTAAYILAGELRRAGGDYALAFRRYQELFGPFVLKKQEAAMRFGRWFAPQSRWALFVRNSVLTLMRVGWIADLAVRRDIEDRIALPDYN